MDNREHPFDVFRDFFFSIQKYFSNADMGSLLDILEESDGRDDRLAMLKAMTEAETVYLSARCYYSLEQKEQAKLLDWINSFLPPNQQLSLVGLEEPDAVERALTVLQQIFETEDDELPLLALHILVAASQRDGAMFVIHDTDEVWETPVLLDGEVVTASSKIGEFDTPMFS